MIRIIEGTPRSDFFLCNGGRFSNIWSGDSNLGGTNYYYLDLSGIQGLRLIEAVIFNGTYYDAENWPMDVEPLFYTTTDIREVEYVSDAVLIKEKDRENLENHYSRIRIDYKPLPCSTEQESIEVKAYSEETVPSQTIPLQTVPPQTEPLQKEVLQTEPPAYEENLELLVTVKESSGGLNIRSGPGTGYEKMGRLAVGETVTVTKLQPNGSSQWGKIDRGWICMDYVETEGQQPDVTESVSVTVCVKPSAGELKIRSGPGSSYNEVGRLQGGEYAIVTELQQNGSSQWGHIPIGWICMDYVDIISDTYE